MRRLTVRKGQRWRSKTPPNQIVVVKQKGYRGGWDVLTPTGKMHNATDWTLNRFYTLIED